MIADQPTETTPQLPRRAQACAALTRLATGHPHLADRDELSFRVKADGRIFASVDVDHPNAVAALRELAAALGLAVRTNRYSNEGTPCVSVTAFGDFDGVHWNCSAHVRADAYAFETFTSTHNPDPLEWTPAERAEYAALVGSATAA